MTRMLQVGDGVHLASTDWEVVAFAISAGDNADVVQYLMQHRRGMSVAAYAQELLRESIRHGEVRAALRRRGKP